MDFFAHGLWTWALYKTLNRKINKPLNLRLALFWGLFPDLFAFTILFMWLGQNFILDKFAATGLPQPEQIEPAPRDISLIWSLTGNVYTISHSIVIFLIVFFIIAGIILVNRFVFSFSPKLQRVPWELSAWLFHILSDILTHTYQFYPTPVLWPLADWKFDGISWRTPWFFALNYSLIGAVYFILFLHRRKKYKIETD